MNSAAHDSHAMYACRVSDFTECTQATRGPVQQNGGHVPTYCAIPAATPLHPCSEPHMSVRSCGDVRRVLWPIPPG